MPRAFQGAVGLVKKRYAGDPKTKAIGGKFLGRQVNQQRQRAPLLST